MRHSVLLLLLVAPVAAQPPVDLGTIAEKHEMVPMRDGTKLSVYLYFPPGKGRGRCCSNSGTPT